MGSKITFYLSKRQLGEFRLWPTLCTGTPHVHLERKGANMESNVQQKENVRSDEFSLEVFNVSGEVDHVVINFSDEVADSMSDGGRRC
jgi:hypothetical protein